MGNSTATTTLTVNSAFLSEVKEVNEDLWRLTDEVRRLCSDPSAIHAAPLAFAQKLEQLRDQLALHFVLEEAYGYFEDSVEVAPRLCELAYSLRAEHPRLYLQICELVDRAARLVRVRRSSREVLEITAAFVSFDDQFRRHEAREVDMIQEEYDGDLGVGD